MRAPQPGEYVRRRGDEARAGMVLLERGTEVRPAELALLIALGRTHLDVGGRPRVAVGTSGDELDEAGAPAEGRIANSNGPVLAALAARAGADPVRLGIARDTLQDVSALVERGRRADVLVTCGGASVGPRDFMERALAAAGARMVFRQVAIKPGRPTLLAVLDGRPAFALPGNPAAAMIGFELFVRPLLRRMQGFREATWPVWRCALAAPLRPLAQLTSLVRGNVEPRGGRLAFVPGPKQGSMEIGSLVAQRALAVVPPGSAELEPGAEVEVLQPGW